MNKVGNRIWKNETVSILKRKHFYHLGKTIEN